jgi:4-amino-4-deoxy-L-arabinose transferase-like glycosyltransferase
MRPAREAIVVVAACGLLYLSGAADVAFYTRGEPREGLVAREMLRTGRWLVPSRPDGEPTRKPPLYYWAAAAALDALPDRPELALRLPSAVFATAAVLGIWATARALSGPSAGMAAAVVLATSFEWTRAATSARIDMTLAAALTAVIAGWMLALAGRGVGSLALAAAGAALGALAKGPVAIVLPALAAGALLVMRRRIAPLRPVVVLGLAAATAGVWYAVAWARTGAAFLDVVARENLFRFVDPEDAAVGHAHGPLYLLPLALVGLLPWTPLLPLALAPLRARPWPATVALAVAWIATTVAFFTLAASKRSVYLLPIHPAIALLVAAGVAAAPDGGRLVRAARAAALAYVPAGALVAAAATLLAAGVDVGALAGRWLRPPDAAGARALATAARDAAPTLVVLAGATLVALVPLVRAIRAAAWTRVVVAVGALFVAWTATFDARLHPAIARERSLRDFFATVRRTLPPDATVYAYFPPDPGVRFYAPPTLRPWPASGAARGSWLLLWEDEWRRRRDASGRPLEVVLVSEASQPRRGHLALVTAPGGPLLTAAPEAAPAAAPGLKTGNRRP